jgi:hypothetical protein
MVEMSSKTMMDESKSDDRRPVSNFLIEPWIKMHSKKWYQKTVDENAVKK